MAGLAGQIRLLAGRNSPAALPGLLQLQTWTEFPFPESVWHTPAFQSVTAVTLGVTQTLRPACQPCWSAVLHKMRQPSDAVDSTEKTAQASAAENIRALAPSFARTIRRA